jgi:type II secretion system protein H
MMSTAGILDGRDQQRAEPRLRASRPRVAIPVRAGSGACAARPGFTLLELILVLVVLGIGSAIAAARLGGMRGTVGVDQAAQRLVDQARRCQHLAATSGHQVRMRLDLKAATVTVAMLDDARERLPDDGQAERITLAGGSDVITLGFARGDAVQSSASAEQVDLLFAPDARCEPAGTLTVASTTRTASVRLFAGARLPELLPAADREPERATP